MLKQSFPPIIPQDANLLILGSLPGDLSIARNEYYAHPQNRFWKVLFTLFEKPFSSNYSDRIQLLKEHHIALWDVCGSAYRPGSMDTAITAVIPNSIPQLLAETPTIEKIFFNGNKAKILFEKSFADQIHVQSFTLPSTSPANAQFTLEKLLDRWKIIRG